MTSAPSEAIRRAIKKTGVVVDVAKKAALAEQCAAARDLELEVEDLAARLKTAEASLRALYRETIPAMMDEIGFDRIGLEAVGNLPAVDLVMKPYYNAGIAASWPEEKRKEAFDWLEAHGHGDLIKTVVEVAFPREEREDAKSLARSMEAAGHAPQLKETVHAGTLKAWLRTQIEDGGELPPLDMIGGDVGRIAVLKERKT